MSTISNRFYVCSLEDGTTLHGNLVADKSLTQAWDGGSAIPNWDVNNSSSSFQPYAQPTIHLTLLSGNTPIADSFINNQKWYYNNQEIYFKSTTDQTTVYTNSAETTTATLTGYWSTDTEGGTSANYRFFKHTVTIGGVAYPALRITSNLAQSTNVDMDLISFSGTYVINNSGVDFMCDTQIRISAITANGYLGVINFVNGISDITEQGQVITLYGSLFQSSSSGGLSYTTKWYLNDGAYTAGSDKTVGGTTYHNAYQVTEANVVDHAIIKCEFYQDTTLLYTAYAAIDDMQDAEFMYIQNNGANGNAASLRKNDEYTTFTIWVGTRDNPEVLGGTTNPTYNSIKLKLLDGDGIVIGGTEDTTAEVLARSASLPGQSADQSTSSTWIPACDSNSSWRTLTLVGGKATVYVHYNTVNGYGKRNLTGILIAYSQTQS